MASRRPRLAPSPHIQYRPEVSAATAPRRVEWLLVILIVAAGGLRVLHLGTESLWLDEAISVTIANDSFARIVDEAAKDVHPPFYYFLLRVWLLAAHPTEAGARLLSVLLGLLLIVSAYALARRLAGRGAALVTAALLALSPFQIQFAPPSQRTASPPGSSSTPLLFGHRSQTRRWSVGVSGLVFDLTATPP